MQVLSLAPTTETSCLVQYGRIYYMAIPQKRLETVIIYRFADMGFHVFQNITGVTGNHIVSFKTDSKVFIAIDGNPGRIYEINESINPIKLFMEHKDVNLWFPIPIQTYREEPILLAQKRVNHTTHQSYAIEAMVYGRGAFHTQDETHCFFYGESVIGINCLVEDENSLGLYGSAVIGNGVHVGLIVPKINSSSFLFNIKYNKHNLDDPYDDEFKSLEFTKSLLWVIILAPLKIALM